VQTDFEAAFNMDGFAEMLVRLVGSIPISRAWFVAVIVAGSIAILTLWAIGVVPPSS